MKRRYEYMKLSEMRNFKTCGAMVENEIYEITNVLSFSYVTDKFNGGMKPMVIVETDKGRMYLPNNVARAYAAEKEDGGSPDLELIGAKVKAVKRLNKKFNKHYMTLEWMD